MGTKQQLDSALPLWVIANTKLVAKSDQLIKRRGKAGLLVLSNDRHQATLRGRWQAPESALILRVGTRANAA